jgi:hypothetical protein
MVRVYLPLDAIAPDPMGRLPTIELRATEELSATGRLIAVPDSIVRAIWIEQFEWRTARLAVSDGSSAIVSLPTPRDSLLLKSRGQYRSGAFGDAALLAVERLSTRRVARDQDRVSAQVQLGLTFSAAGEDLVASYFLADALDAHPCLQFPESAPQTHRQLLDRNRIEGICDTRPLRRLALVSVVPGGAQWTDPRGGKVIGAALLGASAILLTSGISNRLEAASLHEKYLTELIEPQAVYARAESHRATANSRLTMFAGVWVSNWAFSVGRELWLRRRIRIEGDYGAPTSTFGPVDGPVNTPER